MRIPFLDEKYIDNKESALAIADLGIITAYSDGTYKPKGILTRGAMTKVLCSLMIGSEAASHLSVSGIEFVDPWVDVPASNIFAPYIAYFKMVLQSGMELEHKVWIDDLFRTKQFMPGDGITKKTALQWLSVTAAIQFGLDAIPAQADDKNNMATREWVAEQLYTCKKMMDEKAKELSKDEKRDFHDSSNGTTPQNEKLTHQNSQEPPANAYINLPSQNTMLSMVDTNNILNLSLPQQQAIKELTSKCDQFILNLQQKTKKPSTTQFGYKYISLSKLKRMLSDWDDLKKTDAWKAQKISEDDGIGIASPHFKLSMSNVSFFNDPDEGNILLDNFGLVPLQQKVNSYEIVPRDEFITCLMGTPIESLPMWVNYGDGGYGCRIEFDIASFENFYKVIYVERKCLQDAETDFIKGMESIVKLYQENNSIDKTNVVYNCAKQLLRTVGYYYKDAYYEYEKEIRTFAVAKSLEDVLIRESSCNKDELPHIYMELKAPLKVNSIMLGPKCKNPERIAVTLHRLGIKKVYLSSIHFQ